LLRSGDVAALPVGGDGVFGFQPFGHLRRCRPGVLAPSAAAAADGVFEVAVLAGDDQPVRPGAGQVVFGAVAGVGEDQADRVLTLAAAAVPPVPARAAGAGGAG